MVFDRLGSSYPYSYVVGHRWAPGYFGLFCLGLRDDDYEEGG